MQETIDELKDIQGVVLKRFGFAILVLKGHLPVINTQDVSIRDGHAEDVRRKVLKDSLTGSDGFDMANPVLSPHGIRDEVKEVGLFQSFPEISPNQPGQRPDMDEEIRFRPDPSFSILDSAAWDQEVDMEMIRKLTGPRLQDTQKTDFSAKEPFVSCQYHDSLCRRLEEE